MRTCCWAGGVAAALVLASPRALGDEKSHRAAAEEMLKVTNVEKAMQAMMDQMLTLQVKANPGLAPYRDVLKKFYAKYVSYESLKEDIIKLYTKEFTEKELRDIIAFYKTPTGRKVVSKLPELSAKGAQLGAERVQANLGELKKMIEEERKKKEPG